MDCQERCGRVSLVQYPKSHPFAQLTGSDNIIAFTTARYSKQPLIIRCALCTSLRLTLCFLPVLQIQPSAQVTGVEPVYVNSRTSCLDLRTSLPQWLRHAGPSLTG